MVTVVWSDDAIEDLTLIHSYISSDYTFYADRQIQRITHRTKQIGLSPKSGRVVPEYNNPLIRELIEGKYRIIYEIKPEAVWVLRIYHGARLLK